MKKQMTYKEAYEICCKKAKVHFERFNGKLFEPSESENGNYYESYPNYDFVTTKGIWLTSMITGFAPLVYETADDKEALKWANRFKGEYHDKVFAFFTQTMHDLGFLYIPYSVHMYQQTGDTQHRDTAIRAAEELAKRYRPKGHFIEAWSLMNMENPDWRMIIDSSMNVSLLYWAWKETGHYFYREVADSHLDTIINTLVREDYSVAHAWFFDPETGKPKVEANSCGFANGSHWARGTAWLVYGLAMAYSYTKNERYLDIATKVGEKYLDCLEESPVPVWDFRLPEDMPAKCCTNVRGKGAHWDETKAENKIYNVDTSAAAIMCCGFELINTMCKNDRFAEYVDAALDSLVNEYMDTDETNPGMLTRSNGRDLYSTYGDYYFMFALASKLFGIVAPWGNKENN